MPDRLSALLRKGVFAIPVATAALVLAPIANAATARFAPTTLAGLDNAINTANNTNPAGTQNIITLGAQSFTLDTPIVVKSGIWLEITGMPGQQTNFGGGPSQAPALNGQGLFNTSPNSPDITVQSGGFFLMKATELNTGGSPTAPAVLVNGTSEIDNSAIEGGNGNALQVSGGSVTAVNSTMSDGALGGVVNSGGTLNLISDTIYNNASFGLTGSTSTETNRVINTYIVNNNNPSGTSPTNCQAITTGTGGNTTYTTSLADDFVASCGSGGLTYDTSGGGAGLSNAANDTNFTGDYGGPTESTQLLAGNPAIGAGTCADIPNGDQRFWLRSTSPCDIGSYQTTPTGPDTSSAGPKCVANRPIPASGGTAASQTVNVTDQNAIGMGPDAIADLDSHLLASPTTPNGMITYPVAPVGAPFMAVHGGSTPFQTLPSTNTFPVTDMKPSAAEPANDTQWSFSATNWLGIMTACS
jgi:hypothetical protein